MNWFEVPKLYQWFRFYKWNLGWYPNELGIQTTSNNHWTSWSRSSPNREFKISGGIISSHQQLLIVTPIKLVSCFVLLNCCFFFLWKLPLCFFLGGGREWSHFLGVFSPLRWEQLRCILQVFHREQRRTLGLSTNRSGQQTPRVGRAIKSLGVEQNLWEPEKKMC